MGNSTENLNLGKSFLPPPPYLEKIRLEWYQKRNFELNFNLQLRHSCNQNV